MDFHTLSRKELQALCKKNKIPANITNLAMADALSSLPQVEGLDEILNPSEGDFGTPAVQPRTASRTTTQRKTVNRGARVGVAAGDVEQENKDANVPVTPAVVPSSRRRVPVVSTHRKKEVTGLDDNSDDGKSEVQGKPVDVAKTPAVAPRSRARGAGRSVCNKNEIPDGTSVQKAAYSTRRSVRLLGKTLSKMSLVETEDTGLTKNDDVSEEVSGVSEHIEDSFDTDNGAISQTESNVVSQITDEGEVSSLNKADCEIQSQDSDLEAKVVSETERDAEDMLLVEPAEECSEKVSDVEAAQDPESDADDVLQAEPEEEGSEQVNDVEAAHVPSSNLQDSFETFVDSKETGSEQPELEESCDSAEQHQDMEFAASEEVSIKIADQAIAPLTGVVPDVACVDVPDKDDVTGLSEEACMEIVDQAISPLTVVGPDVACVDLPDQEDVAGLSVEASEEASNQASPLNVVVSDDACVNDPEQDVADMPVMVSEEAADEAITPLTVVVADDACVNDPDQVVADVSVMVSEEASMEAADQAIAPLTGVVSDAAMEISSEEHLAENEVPIQSNADEKESSEVDKVILQLSKLDVAQINDQKKDGMGNTNMMKENLKTIDVKNISIRGLKKMIKTKIDGKLNMTDKDDVEKRRTALQALQQNM